MGGDINEVMFDSEKEGRKAKCQRSMDEFKETLGMCHIVDLGYKGDKFTWKRRDRKRDTIKRS